jgi:hypothetical protein
MHVAEIEEDDERNQNSYARTPYSGRQDEQNRQKSPPGLHIELNELRMILSFKRHAVNHERNSRQQDK